MEDLDLTQFEAGKKYSRDEIMSIFGISKSQMSKTTNDVLDFMASFCSFTRQKEGRRIYFHISEIFGPVEKYTTKKVREISKRKKLVAEITSDIIKKDGYYSGSLITRIAVRKDQRLKDCPASFSTKANDVRKYLSYYYGTAMRPPQGMENGDFVGYVKEYAWCIIRKPTKKNDIKEEFYQKMTKDQEQRWLEIRKEAALEVRKDYDKEMLDLEGLSQEDPSIKERCQEFREWQAEEEYRTAMEKFLLEFGGYPVMGNKYEKGIPTEEVYERYEALQKNYEKKKAEREKRKEELEKLIARPGDFQFS